MSGEFDVEVELYDAVARAVLAEYPDAYVSGEHVIAPSSFPAVSIVETSNTTLESANDSSEADVAHSIVYTVDAYSNSSSDSKAQCKSILAIVGDAMSRRNLSCIMARPMDNAADPSIYRMTARYAGVLDREGNLYRR